MFSQNDHSYMKSNRREFGTESIFTPVEKPKLPSITGSGATSVTLQNQLEIDAQIASQLLTEEQAG